MHVVTGGAGFIGSRIARALLARGADVCVVDHAKAPGRATNLADLRVADDLSPSRFLTLLDRSDHALDRVEAVIHQGACADTRERDVAYLIQNNCEYGKRLARWCVDRRVPFLYASTAAVYGASGRFVEDAACEAPLNAYATSKLALDRFIRVLSREAASPLVGLRYFNVYGPGEGHKGAMASVARQFFDQIRITGTARLFVDPTGSTARVPRRDFVHVEDVVAVNLWFLDHGAQSGIFNVGTGRCRTFEDIARVVVREVRSGRLEYFAFPADVLAAYQWLTRADLAALRSAGYTAPFRDPDEGVASYVRCLMDEAPPCEAAARTP